MCKMCSFHGLTRNIQTVLYAFLVRCISIIERWLLVAIPETASSRHCCAITNYSHVPQEIVGICIKVHLWAPAKNIKEIWLVTKAVDLGSISLDFLSSYLWSYSRSLENLWTLSNMRNFITRNFSKNENMYIVFAFPVFAIEGF